MESKLILGPPGTGKTTRLLNIVDEEITRGTPPDKIAFVSFTRKAVLEAIDRAMNKFNITNRAEFPYFRTLHSLCYQELGITRNEVFQKKHFKEIGDILGIEITGYISTEDTPWQSLSIGDKMVFLEGFARATQQNLKETWYKMGEEVDWFTLKQYADLLFRYKEEKGLIDFTDMLERYLMECFSLNIDIAIVDEAQDLTPLQWSVFFHAAKNAKRIYIAGDDDQSIYAWSGADIDRFLSLKVNYKEVLPQSFRVPKSVMNLSNRVINQINHRYNKTWKPRQAEGSVLVHNNFESIELDEGNWLMLSRNAHFLKYFKELCISQGFTYYYRGVSSVNELDAKAIINYEKLRQGEYVYGDIIPLIRERMGIRDEIIKRGQWYNMASSNIPDKGIWHDAFINIPIEVREYYLTVRRRGRKLLSTPTIYIDTIHASKGGESDNVVIATDLVKRTHDGFFEDQDNEHRVFYVGLTRTRKNLHVIMPTTWRYYPLNVNGF